MSNQQRAAKLRHNIARWQAEIERIQFSWRWGETRRFHSNKRSHERREWLIQHIAAARVEMEVVEAQP